MRLSLPSLSQHHLWGDKIYIDTCIVLFLGGWTSRKDSWYSIACAMWRMNQTAKTIVWFTAWQSFSLTMSYFSNVNEFQISLKWPKTTFCFQKGNVQYSQGSGFPLSFFPAQKGKSGIGLERNSVLKEVTWHWQQVPPQEPWSSRNRHRDIACRACTGMNCSLSECSTLWTFPFVTRASYGLSHAFTYLFLQHIFWPPTLCQLV